MSVDSKINANVLYENTVALIKKDTDQDAAADGYCRNNFEDSILAFNEQLLYLNEEFFYHRETVTTEEIAIRKNHWFVTYYPLVTRFDLMEDACLSNGNHHKSTSDLKKALFIKNHLLDPVKNELEKIYFHFENKGLKIYQYVPLYAKRFSINPHTFEPELMFHTLFVAKAGE